MVKNYKTTKVGGGSSGCQRAAPVLWRLKTPPTKYLCCFAAAVVAGVFQSLGWEMTPLVGLLCGVSQTGIVVCSSLTRFLSTL